MAEQAMIAIEHVSKVFPGNRQSGPIVALDDVSLVVPQGSIFGVIGQSGAGKSTLIRCVNGLEAPTSGTVTVSNHAISGSRASDLRTHRRGMGMIFQGFNLLSARNVAGNVALPLEVMGMPRRQRRERVQELLRLVGLEERAHAWPSQLSGGQKQRVGIARALATYPPVLLSDESTSALDPQTTSQILQLMKRLNVELGLTILLITHEMNVITRICDRTALIENGRIVEQGRTRDLLLDPSSRLSGQVFAHVPPTRDAESEVALIVPVAGEVGLPAILLRLEDEYHIQPRVLAGSLENVDGEQVGQFTLGLSGERAVAAATWLEAAHRAHVVEP